MRLNISKTSLCCQGLSVPSTLFLSYSTIFLCDVFEVLIWGLLSHRPGDWDMDWQVDALLAGDDRSRGPMAGGGGG